MSPMAHYKNYHALGARTDCNAIVERFAKLNSLRYNLFAEIWRELKFSCIYYGHNCLEELLVFTEEIFRIAKEIWLKSEALNEQTGGLYLLYGLYLKQPTDGLVKVRLTYKDYLLVEQFHREVREGGHHDVNYVLARMHVIGAFRFCISEYTYGLEKSYRVYHEVDKSLQEVNNEPFYVKRLKNDAIFHKLEDSFKKYHEAKCKLVSETSEKPPPILNYVDSKFGLKLKEQFQKITRIVQDNNSSKSPGSKTGDDKDTSKSKTSDKNTSSNKGYKLPWWVHQTQNRLRKESSSENEEDDPDIVLEGSKTEDSTQDPLIATLGLSGDEEDESDGENSARKKRLQELKDLAEAGSSRDMPNL